MKKIFIYNETKTKQLDWGDIDFEKGYLDCDCSINLDEINTEVQISENEIIRIYRLYTEEQLKEKNLEKLRRQRETECFPIINRGKLWYDTLTAEEREELKAWYVTWLNVTETFVVPDKPAWLTKAVTFVKPEVESNVRDCVGFY